MSPESLRTCAADATDAASALLDRTLVASFLEHFPDAVYFKDHESRFIAVSHSKAQRHGLAPDELVGLCDSDFFSPEHARRSRTEERTIMATGEPVVGKLEKTQWRDGRAGWAEVTKLPLRDAAGAIIGTFGVTRDITEEEQLRAELEKTQRNIVDASRRAGMAEVATGVLHNVGNVLTSLNVSANVVATGLHQSKTASLTRLAELLEEHSADLGDFLTRDPKGRRIPEFMSSLADHLRGESERLLAEVASLQQNIDHIKDIVAMQQAYATMLGVVEPLEPATLMEDAVRMNAGALVRHDVAVERRFVPVPRVRAERAKVLQILVNLIRNAKYAADEGGAAEKLITLGIAPGPAGFVRLSVRDNGIGIAPDTLAKLFTHGFTTRAGGHGFGLHSSAVVAREMQGHLAAHSDGLGHGATFTLDLPVEPAA